MPQPVNLFFSPLLHQPFLPLPLTTPNHHNPYSLLCFSPSPPLPSKPPQPPRTSLPPFPFPRRSPPSRPPSSPSQQRAPPAVTSPQPRTTTPTNPRPQPSPIHTTAPTSSFAKPFSLFGRDTHTHDTSRQPPSQRRAAMSTTIKPTRTTVAAPVHTDGKTHHLLLRLHLCRPRNPNLRFSCRTLFFITNTITPSPISPPCSVPHPSHSRHLQPQPPTTEAPPPISPSVFAAVPSSSTIPPRTCGPSFSHLHRPTPTATTPISTTNTCIFFYFHTHHRLFSQPRSRLTPAMHQPTHTQTTAHHPITPSCATTPNPNL